MRKIILCLIALITVSCANHGMKSSNESLKNYMTKANELVTASKAKNTSAKKMEALGKELIGLATPIILQFKDRHPNCGAFLDYVLQNADYMTTLSVEKIESDFHDGEALPKSPDKCYEAKELVVHPATVVVLARKKFDLEGKQQMADEIQEVLAHIEDLQ